MLLRLLNTLGQWLMGTPWVPFSVRPCPEWILADPCVGSGEGLFGPVASLSFTVRDSRYRNLSGHLRVQQERGEVHVIYHVTNAKAAVPLDMGAVPVLRDDQHLIVQWGGQFMDVGRVEVNQEETTLIRDFLAKLGASQAESDAALNDGK